VFINPDEAQSSFLLLVASTVHQGPVAVTLEGPNKGIPVAGATFPCADVCEKRIGAGYFPT